MNIPALQTVDCTNKHVLMRIDANVDIQALENKTESFRLTILLESIRYILSHSGATLTLISHFGRPEGKVTPEFSLAPLVLVLERITQQKISFTPDCLGVDDFTEARLALRENLRFYGEEEANDHQFAQKLASGFDVYVNEAFSVCHRYHASVAAITKYLPSVAGIRLQNEMHELSNALLKPARPSVAILGGAKIETKLPLIHTFEKTCDSVLLGGLVANEAIDKHISLQDNVLLPIDFRGSARLDIGDQTILRYSEIIAEAQSIIWNGPLGKFEEAPYDMGTMAIIKALCQSNAYTVAGGGESLTAIQKAGTFYDFNFVSAGGGAMLTYLAGQPMPGLVALESQGL